MVDVSNPTGRVLDIIRLLASQPSEEFSLADIAQQTAMSKASAHRVLLTLADADFLARHPKRRTYSLGMGLLAVGQAALEKYRGLDLARAEMARLSAELNVQCSATALVGGELLILARDGLPQSYEGLNRVGERRPMIPPMGICHVAWGSEHIAEPYLVMAKQHMKATVYAWLLKSLALIRSRGYALATHGPTWRKLRHAPVLPGKRSVGAAHASMLDELIGALSRDEVQLAEIDDKVARKIGQIAAPVFAADRSVAFQLVISGLPATLTRRKLERHIEALLAAAAAVTHQMGGAGPALRADS